MNPELEYLRMYLEDEFQRFPGVRVRIRLKSGTKRSIDLEQDYDPESQTLHKTEGVEVRAGSRDYLFPSDWASPGQRNRVDSLIREIRDFLGEQ